MLCLVCLHIYTATFDAYTTPAGAQSSAVIYSLVETAKENGLDPFRYLCWIMKSAPAMAISDADWASKLVPSNAPQEVRAKQTE